MAPAQQKKTIAVFTSGGDAPGMNAVVRACARVGMYYGHDVYAIYEGYQGLVDGGDSIKKLEWNDVSMIIHRGGTVIGSARCMEFRERAGRLRAAENLLKHKITNLICCGGDGSLTGANLFRLEWRSLLDELVAAGRVSKELADECGYLNLVGLVGSIDNDMVYEGELTIGTDTALHRIVEAIDAITSTAASHQRTFVMEVMGRHCGYLAWASAVACGADFVLIPEAPPETDDWATVMCTKLEKRRKLGQRMNLIIVAEGAIDRNGNAITSEMVRKVIVDRLKHDTRTTILGHVQRGGQTSAYDRILGTISGAAAVEKVLMAKEGDPATIVGLRGWDVVYAPLVESVKNTQLVAQLTDKKDFAGAIKARGKDFDVNYHYHRLINGTSPKVPAGTTPGEFGIGMMCVGAPAAGMNSAMRACARFGMNFGYKILGINTGFDGLMAGDIKELNYMDVDAWSAEGGSILGTTRTQPTDMKAVAAHIAKFNIKSLFVIGGFEAYSAVLAMRKAQKDFPELNIPIVQIPATISNNAPGTDFSVGCDTGLNACVDALDRCKVSADASRHRVFLVETQGADCGFLAAMSALAAGADRAYVPEEGVSLSDLKADYDHIIKRMGEGGNYSVLVRNERCSPTYDLNFMYNMFKEEGKNVYTTRSCRLGHMCQGLYPSPLDRVRAAQLAAKAADFLSQQMAAKGNGVMVVGMRKGQIVLTPAEELEKVADFKLRRPVQQEFINYLPLLRQLAGHPQDDPKTHYAPEVLAVIRS